MLHCPMCQNKEVTMELNQIKIQNDSIMGYECKCGAVFFMKREIEQLILEKDKKIEEMSSTIDELTEN